MAGLTLRNVSKTYGAVNVMEGLDLDIVDGEFLVLVGPSGCGKSTLLRMIAGLEEITDGTIAIENTIVNDLPASKRELAMVFQSYALYPHMSVRKNLAFGLQNMKLPKAEIDKRVAEVASVLQIEPLLDRKPRQLSGGQKQRVAIGRSIVREPKLFLFDEPLSNLDAELRVQMRVELASLYTKLGTTMIYVTHDQIEAMTMASRIVVLRKGKIEQVGTPQELYTRPENLFVAGFIGSPKINMFDAKATKGARGIHIAMPDFNDFEIDGLERTVDDVTVCIRPECFIINGGSVQVEATVELVEYLGSEVLLHTRLGSGAKVLLQTSGRDGFAKGQKLSFGFEPGDVHVFDHNGDRVPYSGEKALA
ncbi:sn-glycerol-3-phosphate ABC transporter ATP-binding protein UgpC [Celeribacter arenosi]|uniref:Sn-glycerol-3-phosphate ABC transporter ATP-binding protein UgpC n=1 Tax=Celeribacter arenosi TaxID=792649 RepID=A0ABP7K4R7_9RHOB